MDALYGLDLHPGRPFKAYSGPDNVSASKSACFDASIDVDMADEGKRN